MASFPYWAKPVEETVNSLNSTLEGLSGVRATEILKNIGANSVQSKKHVTPLGLFFNQLKSPKPINDQFRANTIYPWYHLNSESKFHTRGTKP